MKAKENVKNDEINLQADTLADLPLDNEKAAQTRAGSGSVTLLGPPATSEEKKIEGFSAFPGFLGGVNVGG